MSTADVWCAIAVMFFIVTDYVTGVAKAIMQDNLSSKKMREGLGHKFAYFILVLTAWFIDEINLHVGPSGIRIRLYSWRNMLNRTHIDFGKHHSD